jgi:hypothetical protein
MDDIAEASDVTNSERADWANAALTTFARVTGQLGDLDADGETVLSDLLADLHHWADALGIDWESASGRGDYHYVCEIPDGFGGPGSYSGDVGEAKIKAFDAIHAVLDGAEWEAETVETVAEIVGAVTPITSPDDLPLTCPACEQGYSAAHAGRDCPRCAPGYTLAPTVAEHVPGTVFAPVFGLPGQQSSVCVACDRAIVRAGRGEPWTVA